MSEFTIAKIRSFLTDRRYGQPARTLNAGELQRVLHHAEQLHMHQHQAFQTLSAKATGMLSVFVAVATALSAFTFERWLSPDGMETPLVIGFLTTAGFLLLSALMCLFVIAPRNRSYAFSAPKIWVEYYLRKRESLDDRPRWSEWGAIAQFELLNFEKSLSTNEIKLREEGALLRAASWWAVTAPLAGIFVALIASVLVRAT